MTTELDSRPRPTQGSDRRARPVRVKPVRRSSLSPMGSMAFLRLMWLASPALPVGGFSYSEGLEAAFESGRVQTEEDLLSWLQDQLHLGLARGDLAVASKAFVAWQRADGPWLKTLNDWVLHTRESSELRLQTEQMGRSLCVWLSHQGLAPEHTALLESLTPCPTWPVAFALAAFLTQGPQREALLAMGFAWAENMVQAALKTGRMGQIAGQRILGQLSREIPAAVETAMKLPEAHRQAFTPMLAILSARHETQYSRLFRS